MGRDSTYSGGKEPMKIFLSSLLQTGFTAGPVPELFYNLPSLGIVVENLGTLSVTLLCPHRKLQEPCWSPYHTPTSLTQTPSSRLSAISPQTCFSLCLLLEVL